ncbi:MAG: haloacid dehalogenase-like hydrolase [candidate division WOR-3 bacterium]|nr:haloacid dehalogenase-like hydrolase [candidate division WOR-3 bacterium]MCX7757686.1 haloacid dehalogenase-like hydrolase [candidate division WOR-3 bacterium]MDW7988317.1 haloacid dehalogenase-like hydrolase [candidate division WOR-3 bacterium]
MRKTKREKKYLFVSDFDQTISLDDSGTLISQAVGIPQDRFLEKVKAIRNRNIVQLGGELAYLLVTDPEYKGKVSKDTFIKVGKEIRLKNNVSELFKILNQGIEHIRFLPYVVSACPKPLIVKSLENILPEEQIFGTDFRYDHDGRVIEIDRTAAGQGKVAIVDSLIERVHVPREQVIYVGDGSSDLHVMLHVNVYGGFTIAVSPSPYLGHISKRTVLSDNALAVLVPILEFVLNYDEEQIKEFFNDIGHPIFKWNRAQTEWLTIE